MTAVNLLLALVAAQSLDLLAWAQAPHLEANLVPAAGSPAEVVALKAAGVVAVVIGSAVLRLRGLPSAASAVLLVGAGVGLLGAMSAAVVLHGVALA